jgi:hypothetical protein
MYTLSDFPDLLSTFFKVRKAPEVSKQEALGYLEGTALATELHLFQKNR